MTTPKRKKLSLFLFIDAFGWTVQQRQPEFLKGLVQDRRPLDTILGYSSACDPSIISGRMPAEHGLWSSYYYDPDGSPFKWTRPLRWIPEALYRRGRVRNLLSRIIRKRCGFTGYYQLHAVPPCRLPLFNYAEQKRIWEPGGLPYGDSIFDRLGREGIPYFVHPDGTNDAERFERLTEAVRRERIDFAYCSFGRLDGLMHQVGNAHPDIDALMCWYDEHIRALLETAENHYDEVTWYLFTDHGMHNVTEAVDLMADIEALGLTWNRDYAAFYDSTMARFWILDEAARAPLTACLANHAKGRLLSGEELRAHGVWFEDGQYGDLIFLMNSGVQIVPSFMSPKAVPGMHGYDPDDADSKASILSSQPLPESITHIRHIHRLMLNELNLS